MNVIDILGDGTESVTPDGTPPGSTAKLVSADEIVRRARPTTWVVDGRIAAYAVSVIAGGAKKSYKTTMLLRMAECVSRGIPWLGRPTYRRPVIFTGFEGGEEFLGQRLLEVGHESALLPDEMPAPFDFATDLGGYELVLAKMRAHAQAGTQWPILWIVDTLSQVFAIKGVDENNNMETTNYLRELDLLARQVAAAIIAAHHFNKYNHQMRGASAIGAIANWAEITQFKGAEPGTLKLDWTLRHGPSIADAVRVSKPNGTFEFLPLDPKEQAKIAMKSGGARDEVISDAIVAILRSRNGSTVTLSDLIDGVGRVVSGRKPGQRAIREAVRKLGESGAPIWAGQDQGQPGFRWGGSDSGTDSGTDADDATKGDGEVDK